MKLWCINPIIAPLLWQDITMWRNNENCICMGNIKLSSVKRKTIINLKLKSQIKRDQIIFKMNNMFSHLVFFGFLCYINFAYSVGDNVHEPLSGHRSKRHYNIRPSGKNSTVNTYACRIEVARFVISVILSNQFDRTRPRTKRCGFD